MEDGLARAGLNGLETVFGAAGSIKNIELSNICRGLLGFGVRGKLFVPLSDTPIPPFAAGDIPLLFGVAI
jgi:hypothetical protein